MKLVVFSALFVSVGFAGGTFHLLSSCFIFSGASFLLYRFSSWYRGRKKEKVKNVYSSELKWVVGAELEKSRSLFYSRKENNEMWLFMQESFSPDGSYEISGLGYAAEETGQVYGKLRIKILMIIIYTLLCSKLCAATAPRPRSQLSNAGW